MFSGEQRRAGERVVKSKPTRTRLTPRGQKILTACLEQPTWERAAGRDPRWLIALVFV